MKNNVIKRSIAILLSLLVIITASSVGVASAAWVDLNPESTTEQEAVLKSWSDQDLAESDGTYLEGETGSLTNLAYRMKEEYVSKTVGIRYEANPGTSGKYRYDGDTCMPLHHVYVLSLENLKFTQGTTVRFYYKMYVENWNEVSAAVTYQESTDAATGEKITTSTTTLPNDFTSDTTNSIGMWIRVYGKNNLKVMDEWSCKNNLGGIYNLNTEAGVYGNEKNYGYTYRTITSTNISVNDALAAGTGFSASFIPGTKWDYGTNPINIYEFGCYTVDSTGKKIQDIYVAKGEALTKVCGTCVTCNDTSCAYHGEKARITCKPVTVKVPETQKPPHAIKGAYKVVGRKTTTNGFYKDTKDYFLFDDFIPYTDKDNVAANKGMESCKNLTAGDDLTVRFQIAVDDVSKFTENAKLKAILKARYTTADNMEICNVHLDSSSFSTLGQLPTSTTTLSDGEKITTTPCLDEVGTTMINGEQKATYAFSLSIINIKQIIIGQLEKGVNTPTNSGLNLLLGLNGADYANNPITLLMWSVTLHDRDNGNATTKLVKREGYQVAYYGGSGPAYEYVYEYDKATYKPDLMNHCYIPTDRDLSSRDSGFSYDLQFPHAGEYTLRTNLQGDSGKPYTVKLMRETAVGTVIHEKILCQATGKREDEELTFQIDDLNDKYFFIIENDTGNNLSVFSIQLLCDAQASLDGTIYPDLSWALEKATANSNVVLLADVDCFEPTAVIIPAQVSLNLDGHNLKVRNLLSFGQVIDGDVGGKGSLTLVDTQGQPTQTAVADLQVNNTFMPLYDSANQCYRFYDYEIFNAGCKASDNGRVVKYGYKLRFYDVSAFELLAKGDTGLSVVVDVNWDGNNFLYQHPISAKSLKDYAVSVKGKLPDTPMDSIGTALVLTVSKVHHIGAGNSIHSTPTVISRLTGVSGSGDKASYAYKG